MPLEQDQQALIEQRREIDRALLERHAVDMAVLFTDIVGSTAYFEQRGDIEGLALVHRHNDLLFPVVKVNHGRVIKTIGDSIMAVFKEPGDAVVCAVALQETLAQETGTASVERIRIRVGVHFGRVLKDGEDVFGDTVNTAARVASAADGDEILLSLAVLEAIDGSKRPATMPRRALSAKGKSAPVPVAAVAWRAQDRANAEAMSPAAQELFLIEVARGPVGLRVAAMDGEAERGTVKAYADVPLGDDEIDTLGAPFAVLAHDGGRGAYAEALVERGRALFHKALPERVRARIVETKRKTVRLHLEDTLVHAPWELLHDGTDFLGCRFSVGRMVAARADAAVPPPSLSATDIVIVANPSGDLPHAEEEGRVVEKLFTAASALGGAGTKPVHASGKLTRAALLSLVERARILHFAGHVVPGDAGGFVVADGVVSASDLQAVLKKSAPALVFA
ncbi:MAG TPA: adenylate/guanylate cyclase domain-containing protein, partial [Myxococcota bacterium]